jgi:hypothetical protein
MRQIQTFAWPKEKIWSYQGAQCHDKLRIRLFIRVQRVNHAGKLLLLLLLLRIFTFIIATIIIIIISIIIIIITSICNRTVAQGS